MATPLLALALLAPQFLVGDGSLGVERADGFEPIYIKAVNLGSGTPGRFGSEHSIGQRTYARWFEQMSDVGFNAVRVFDLQNPAMYRALAAHNKRADSPLYLLQGVWLDDNLGGGLASAGVGFDREIRRTIDAVHGRADIAKRRGRAHGVYRADVSPWTLAWIIGRELSPAEVAVTDRAAHAPTRFHGTHFSLASGTATEAWLAERFDRAVAYERTEYRAKRPIASVSWPPLDPLHHESARHYPAKPGAPVGLDDVSVDITRIKSIGDSAGHFAAYSVYPYYPEFIWRERAHADRDDVGPNRYLGYLRRLRAHYGKTPLVVAEYGVPSSQAPVTREPVSRMSFGGASESEQGIQNARLTRNIAQAGCAGGALFSWTDEWWKPTWILAKTSNSQRLPMWHDRLSPEQNFGLIGFDAARSAARDLGNGISAAASPTGIALTLRARQTTVLIDTDGDGTSDLRLAIGGESANLTERTPSGFANKTWTTREAVRQDDGSLRTSMTETLGQSLVVKRRGELSEVELPWTLLGFSDPSRRQLTTGATAGVVFEHAGKRGLLTWSAWDHIETVERQKKSLAPVREALAALDQTDRIRSRRTSARTSATGSVVNERSRSSRFDRPSEAKPRAAANRTRGSGSTSPAAISSATSTLAMTASASRATVLASGVKAPRASAASTAIAGVASR